MDTSGATPADAELCTAEVWVVVMAIVDVASGAADIGGAMLGDTWVVVTTFMAVMDLLGEDVAPTGDRGAAVLPVQVVTGAVFSSGVTGVEVVSSLEGVAAAGVVTLTPSVGTDAVTAAVFAGAAVATLGGVAGGGGVAAGDVLATATVVTCDFVDT